MLSLCRHFRDRLRDQSGLAALEFLLVVGVWMMSLAFLFNVALLLGNGMVMQAEVNRLALQASAQGCVSAESEAVVEGLTNLLARDISVASASSDRVANGDFDRGAALDMIDAGEGSAACPRFGVTRDAVAEGDYILIDLRYSQKLLMFPSIEVEKTALSISNSFNRATP